MELPPLVPQILDPVESLLADIVEEGMIEIIANQDSVLFWAKIKDHLYDSPLVSFEENYTELINDLASESNGFDHFLRFTQRILAKPYALGALKKIEETFNWMNKGTGHLEKITVIQLEQNNRVKQLYYFISIYSHIITYRITAIKTGKGDE